jgi:hypothetical protein
MCSVVGGGMTDRVACFGVVQPQYAQSLCQQAVLDTARHAGTQSSPQFTSMPSVHRSISLSEAQGHAISTHRYKLNHTRA